MLLLLYCYEDGDGYVIATLQLATMMMSDGDHNNMVSMLAGSSLSFSPPNSPSLLAKNDTTPLIQNALAGRTSAA